MPRIKKPSPYRPTKREIEAALSAYSGWSKSVIAHGYENELKYMRRALIAANKVREEMKNGRMDDGGPAFPNRHDECCGLNHNGMTLRDYFAAAVLQGLLGSPRSLRYKGKEIESCSETVKVAYAYASAMLKARQEGKDGS